MTQTDSAAFKAWFQKSAVVDSRGKPLVVYHGSRRPDRIGARFQKSRATSGPMPFFTDSAELAGKYATGKQDTSLEPPSDYSGWFKMKVGRSEVALDRAWWFLTAEQRQAITEKLPHVVVADETGSAYDGEYRFDPNEYGLAGKDHWDYEIRRARGNVLKAAVEVWLSSGSLFNSEEEFSRVLDLGGAKGLFRFDSPHAEYPGVFPVYLSIQKPVESLDVPTEVVEALAKASRRQRIPRSDAGADQWDKRIQHPQTWMERLTTKMEDPGAGYAWTTIPDWVTRTLKGMGYDGIHDRGGKGGGEHHGVWVPFEPGQIKSATGNRGTFDPKDSNILHGVGRTPWMRTPGGRRST